MQCSHCQQFIKKSKVESHEQRCRPEAKPPPQPVLGRSVQEWDAIFPRYPQTHDGCVESYPSNRPQDYLPLLQQYGFCVVQVFSPEECEATVAAMFEDLNKLQDATMAVARLDPEDPATWASENWPNPGGKFLTNVPTFCRQAWHNRLHPNVIETFENIYGTSHLVTSVDNWGVFRGTRNLQIAGETVSRPEWSTDLPIHWHINPWATEEKQEGCSGPKYMSLVSLTDSPLEVGGHLTVPGSAAHLSLWAKENANLRPAVIKPTLYVPTGAIFKRYIQKIPLRQGEMIIWDMRQAHGAFANTSNKMRLYQFIRYIPADEQSQREDKFSPLNVFSRHPDEKQSAALQSVLEEKGERGWYLVGLKKYPKEFPDVTTAAGRRNPTTATTTTATTSSTTLATPTSTMTLTSTTSASTSTLVTLTPTTATTTIVSPTTPYDDNDDDDDDDFDVDEMDFIESEDEVSTTDDDDTDFEVNEGEENFAAAEAVRMAEGRSERPFNALVSSPVSNSAPTGFSKWRAGKILFSLSCLAAALTFVRYRRR